ncbi:DUF4097 family beta strand repeat-containing protein [Alkalihalobacillus sp. 1P02AB]|uniref:DUF4097 family beta strand repeat-containing protein n=1 Tax=Alkalihalobacillus sp. 1P02AB TaxID=3132260 RepID=UPI0039A46D61
MNWNLPIKKIVGIALFLIGLSIIGNVVLYQYGHSPFNLATLDVTKQVEANSVESIEVVTSVGDVQLRTYEGDEIIVSLEGETEQKLLDNYELVVQQSQSNLFIELVKKPTVKLFSVFPDYGNLTIQIPEKELSKLKVSNNVGSIRVFGVTAENFELYASVGLIQADEVKGEITARSEVGVIDLKVAELVANIKAHSSVGDVQVTLIETPAALRHELRSQLGGQSVDLPASVNVNDETAPLVELTTEVGNVSLKSNGR